MGVNERKANKVITIIAIIVFAVILGFTGYMFLGHEDSKFQEWITDLKQEYEKETGEDVNLEESYVTFESI